MIGAHAQGEFRARSPRSAVWALLALWIGLEAWGGATAAAQGVAGTGDDARDDAAAASDGAAEDDLEARYRRRIEPAVAAFNEGRWADAHRLFADAHGILPNARTLRGMGIAAERMGDLAESFVRLEAALSSDERPLTQAQRAEVQGIVNALRDRVAFLTVKITPPGASLSVDRAPPLLDAAGRLVLAPGPHVIRAEGNREQAEVRVTAKAGESTALALVLAAATQSTREAAGRDAPPASDLSLAGQSGGDAETPWLLWGAGGVFAAGAIGSAVLWADANASQSKCDDPPAGKRCSDASQNSIDTAQTVWGAGTIGLGVLAATGFLFALLESLSEDAASSARASGCSLTLTSLACPLDL